MDKNWKLGAATLVSSVALTCMLGQPALAADTITMQIYAAEAPNFYGAPGFSGWAANAVYAVEHNLTTYGAPGPMQYQQVYSGTDSSNIVTSFPSWDGITPPPAGYSSQLGNRLTFMLVVTDSSGANINLSQLRGVMTSSDGANTFGFTYDWSTGQLVWPGGSFTSPTDYSAYQQGLINGNPTPVTSGPDTQNVNELVVVGLGNALANTSGATCSSLGATQAALNCVKSQYDALMPFDITASYSLVGGPGPASGSASIPFPAPEPGTLALFGSAVAGLGLLGKRRKKA
jgi:hypothetical protein